MRFAAPPRRTSASRCVVLDLEHIRRRAASRRSRSSRAAIDEFRKSGKKVIAYGTSTAGAVLRRRAGRRDVPRSDGLRAASTATTAIACTSRTRSTSSASTSTCSASAPTRAPPRSTCATTCRRRSAKRACAYLNALWLNYRSRRRRGRASSRPRAISEYVGEPPCRRCSRPGAMRREVALDAKLVTGLKSRSRSRSGSFEMVGEDRIRVELAIKSRLSDFKDYAARGARREKLNATGTARVGVIVAAGRDPRRRSAARHHRRRIDLRPDPRGAPRRGRQSGRAAGRQPRRQRARFRADLSRSARAARQPASRWWSR